MGALSEQCRSLAGVSPKHVVELPGPCRGLAVALTEPCRGMAGPCRSLGEASPTTLSKHYCRSRLAAFIGALSKTCTPPCSRRLVRSMVETCPKPVRTRSCVPSRLVVAMFEALYRSIVRRMCRSLIEALLVACLRSLAEAKFGACCRSLPKPCSQPLSQQVRSNNEALPKPCRNRCSKPVRIVCRRRSKRSPGPRPKPVEAIRSQSKP